MKIPINFRCRSQIQVYYWQNTDSLLEIPNEARTSKILPGNFKPCYYFLGCDCLCFQYISVKPETFTHTTSGFVGSIETLRIVVAPHRRIYTSVAIQTFKFIIFTGDWNIRERTPTHPRCHWALLQQTPYSIVDVFLDYLALKCASREKLRMYRCC